MDQMKLKAIMTFCAALFFALSPLVSPRFSGFSPDLMPVLLPYPPLQPAGWTFAIWGPIFVALVFHAGFGLFGRDTDPLWDRTRWPLTAAMLLGTPWIGIATVSPVWGTILIWAMLCAALVAFRRAPLDRDRWWVATPLALFAGWLTAAAWVALSSLAAGYGLGGAALWGWLGLFGALVSALWVQRMIPEPVYGGAVIWALIGVTAAAYDTGRLAFGIAALAGAGVMLGAALRARKNRSPI